MSGEVKVRRHVQRRYYVRGIVELERGKRMPVLVEGRVVEADDRDEARRKFEKDYPGKRVEIVQVNERK